VKDLLLFDADSPRYAAGFATQKTLYSIRDSKTEYKKKSEAKAVAKAEGLLDTDITSRVIPEELSHCLQVLKDMLQAPLDLIPHNQHRILVTKGTNFRHDLATIKEYKAGRSAKPFYHAEMVEYMDTYWDAFCLPNLEADDLVGMWHTQDSTCVGIDKDLLTVPGLHYNYKKKEYLEVTELDALRYFYTQLLEGDGADNIKGLPACSPESIKKYGLPGAAINGCGKLSAAKVLQGADSEAEMFQRVRDCWLSYNKHANILIKGYEDVCEQDTDKDILETGRLLHLTRELTEDGSPILWEFPADRGE
jgi:hypothetical protein